MADIFSASADTTGVAAVCSRLLGRAVTSVERIAGGRNSQVYRLDCLDDSRPARFAAKQYYSVREDPRDRLQTEFRALQFLKQRGVTDVPAPIALDAASRVAIYEFVDGDRASEHPIGPVEIRQALDFLLALRALARQGGARDVGPASEACFSIDAILDNVNTRLARLLALPADAPGVPALIRFLRDRFVPFAATLGDWIADAARASGIPHGADVDVADRTLSPSDFGFHNALRGATGRLVFVDFEYFGWDDPAKTLVDFLLHPGMSLTDDQKRAFALGLLGGLGDVARLPARARIVYPLFGLKWCLILLNEFVPEHLRRRSFASAAEGCRTDLLDRQLYRAERLLDRLNAEYRHNIYFE